MKFKINNIFIRFPNNKIINECFDFWSRHDSNIKATLPTGLTASQRDFSHWLGEGRWKNHKKWFEIGEQHYKMFKELVSISNCNLSFDTMIEWGPGGGSNAIAFSRKFQTYYGVDISVANLMECEKQLQKNNYKGFRQVLFNDLNDKILIDIIHEPVSFFLSTAVFQHFPSKEYGARVLKIIYQILDNNGIALIQIRYDNGSSLFRDKKINYTKNVATFTSYKIDEFWDLLIELGFSPLLCKLNTENNYAYYFIQKIL